MRKLSTLIGQMNIEGLVSFLENTPGHYSDYSSLYGYLQRDCLVKRIIWKNLYEYLGIDFNNKSILDLGPGSGESLDVAKDSGAINMGFIDRDVIMFRYNQLKGYNGYNFDYTTSAIKDFKTKYDIVLSAGAFNSDYLNEHSHELLFKDIVEWIESIGKELIIIIPTFKQGNGGYTCENYNDFMKSEFSQELLSRDFKTCFVNGCNVEKVFPVTFYKYML